MLKLFLYLSRLKQKTRFLDRLDEPDKNWKFSMSDVQERKYWDMYMDAYEEMIRNTRTEHAPWFVVPANHTWFSRMVVAEVIIHALQSLDLAFPKLDAARRKELNGARGS